MHVILGSQEYIGKFNIQLAQGRITRDTAHRIRGVQEDSPMLILFIDVAKNTLSLLVRPARAALRERDWEGVCTAPITGNYELRIRVGKSPDNLLSAHYLLSEYVTLDRLQSLLGYDRKHNPLFASLFEGREHPHFRYFDFHPAPATSSGVNVSPDTHGLIPVWGFGTIKASNHPKLSVGERVYGYFAPTRYLVLPISSNDVNKFAAYVPRPHLPRDRRPYNQILRCASDPQYNPAHEELTMLYRPLFWTSYWFEDYLYTTLLGYSAAQPGDRHINFLISSASSKTAFCLAYLIQSRISAGQADSRVRIIGLTSAKNTDFTKGLGLYTDVRSYDTDLAPVINDAHAYGCVYVDVAGNEGFNSRLTAYFGGSTGTPRLVKAVSLGLTNLSPTSKEGSTKEWKHNTFSSTPESSQPAVTNAVIDFEQFFMPEWLSQQQRQLPIHEIFSRQKKAWDALMRDCQPWLTLERIHGPENVLKAYREIVRGGVGPEKGMVWSMWDNNEKRQMEAKL
ncbi:hypothetical protein NP233_g3525 [Leucocoprinus birnbaumii]|uniref:Uncharacterized protein n=1 Tax=Leucocoprinus birnbaumii TaxID=56174 RepID=A0AAD5W063_9AGAR|nr:hypothetical protein NP233_g3525 [Leucocoprinus birnbaumii]